MNETEEAVKLLMTTNLATLLNEMCEAGEDVIHFQVEFADAALDVLITLRQGELQ